MKNIQVHCIYRETESKTYSHF